MNANETTGSYFTTQHNPSTVDTFSEETETEARLSGKKVSIGMYSNESPQIPEQNNGDEGKTLKTRKTGRVLATLSAIAMGSASVIIMQTAAHVGRFTLGAAGAILGSMIDGEGPITERPITEGVLIGFAVGRTIGYFIGFSVAAYQCTYTIAQAYNFVLEASNGTDCERSKLADRIVAYYEQ